MRKAIAAAILGILLPSVVAGQTVTIAPTPFQTVFDNNGRIVAGACVWSYLAGTSTPATTYSTSSGTTNANPIIADSAGRFTVYFTTGASYKLVYENTPCSSISHGSILRTADNIAATPANSVGVDVTGTAGEAITAGQAVYLSDGSGGKNAGQWYKADSANVYSSVAPEVGIATTTISAASSGAIRITGSVSGLTSLSVGSAYYVGTAGALTATPPTNRRPLGVADSASTLVLTPWPISSPPPPLPAQGRLTLTTGTPVTTADVTGASTIYYTPLTGNLIALFDGSATWNTRPFSELSLALSGLVTAQAYDIFAYDNSGTPALETAEWANATVTMTIAAPGVVTWTAHGLSTGMSITFTTTGALPTGVTANTQYFVTVVDANTFKLSTTLANVAAGTWITTSGTQSGTHTGHQPQARQTALTLQNGVYVKSGSTTRRYLGTALMTAATTTEDSAARRYLYNYYNRRPRTLSRAETTASWTYSTNAWRSMNGAEANRVEVVVGVAEDPIALNAFLSVSNNNAAAVSAMISIGEMTVSTPSTSAMGGVVSFPGTWAGNVPAVVTFLAAPSVGLHWYLGIEIGGGSATTTFATPPNFVGGTNKILMNGWIWA